MKHLKLKTGLSALAIAFAVAGAINLQTMAVANAEDNYADNNADTESTDSWGSSSGFDSSDDDDDTPW